MDASEFILSPIPAKSYLEVEDKRYSDIVLWVEVLGNLLGIDMGRFGRESTRISNWPFPVPTCYFFKSHQAGFPVGMNHVKFQSRLYFIGGCRLRRDVLPAPFLHNYSGCSLRPSDEVFEFDGKSVLKITDTIPNKLNAPKGESIVVEIGGKIYVLLIRIDGFNNEFFRSPPFEVYDPATLSWTALPDPPFYDREITHTKSDIHIHGHHFVLGHKLYIWNYDVMYFFDARTLEWGFDARMLLQFRAADIDPPVRGSRLPIPLSDRNDVHIMVSMQANKDKAWYQMQDAGPVNDQVCAVLMDKKGRLLCYQIIRGVFEKVLPRSMRMSYSTIIPFGNLEGQMCAILSGIDECSNNLLCISIMYLEPNVDLINERAAHGYSYPVPEAFFLNYCIIRDHVCRLTDRVPVHDAFIL